MAGSCNLGGGRREAGECSTIWRGSGSAEETRRGSPGEHWVCFGRPRSFCFYGMARSSRSCGRRRLGRFVARVSPEAARLPGVAFQFDRLYNEFMGSARACRRPMWTRFLSLRARRSAPELRRTARSRERGRRGRTADLAGNQGRSLASKREGDTGASGRAPGRPCRMARRMGLSARMGGPAGEPVPDRRGKGWHSSGVRSERALERGGRSERPFRWGARRGLEARASVRMRGGPEPGVPGLESHGRAAPQGLLVSVRKNVPRARGGKLGIAPY